MEGGGADELLELDDVLDERVEARGVVILLSFPRDGRCC